ncbi:MAG: nuclear transport factor 2 family protein [Ignavibacteria bacterium]|nr:nuclear transport factor 2 family protein [Ignavibacteria bacterium]
MEKTDLEIKNRKEQLKKIAENYFESFKTKSFAAIPYSEDVVLRAPIAPGGVHNPLNGKQAVLVQWWQPLEPALDGVVIKITDHFYNDSLTGIITKAEFTLTGPGITLRVADLFIVNEDGLITEQENHFDASPLRG